MKTIIFTLCILIIPVMVFGDVLLTVGETDTIVWKHSEASVDCMSHIDQGGHYEDKACQKNIIVLIPNGAKVVILSKTKSSRKNFQWHTVAKVKLFFMGREIIGYVDINNIIKQ